MSFAYSAGVITQTGTDANLSGLSGLTGVTTWASDPDTAAWGQNIYVIDASTRLEVRGTLTIEPDQEMLVIERPALNSTDNCPLDVESGAVLNLGVAKTGNGQTIYSNGVGLNFTDQGINAFGYFGLLVRSGGTFNWNGGVFRSACSPRFISGAIININKGVFYNSSDASFQFRMTPTNQTDSDLINIYDLTFDGLTHAARYFNTFSAANAVFTLNRGEAQQYNGVYPEQTLLNFNNANNVHNQDYLYVNSDASRAEEVYIKNPAKAITYAGSGATIFGYTVVQRAISLSPINLGGSGVTYSYYGVDTNNGSRAVGPMNATDGSQDDTADKVYSGLLQTGAITEDLWIQISIRNGSTTIAEDERTNAGKMPIRVISYNESITTWSKDLYGLGTLTEDVTMTPDLSITEAVKATVDAYTTLDNASEFYDRAKADLVDNYAGETSTTVSRSGTVIDATGLTITVNGAGATVYDLTGTVITIKSSNYTGGFANTTISHGSNNPVFTDLVLENSTWNADQATWTGSADATSTVDVQATGTYDATGFTFDAAATLNNDTGGVVNIVISNGQQQPTVVNGVGASTNFLNAGATLTFNNLTSANVQIIEDDNITVAQRSTSQTGTLVYNTPDGSSGTWCYVINRAGYEPITGTYTADGGDVTVNATQTEKRMPDGTVMYQGTSSAFLAVTTQADGSRMNLRIGDGAVSGQAGFDEVEDALQTQDGMTYLCNGGGQCVLGVRPNGTFFDMGTNVRLIRDNAGDVNAEFRAIASSLDGTVIDGTNGSVIVTQATSDVNVISVNGTSTTSIDDFKADVSLLATQASVDTVDTVVDAIKATTDTNLDATVSSRSTFDSTTDEVTTDTASRTASQADVSSLATQASIDALNNFDPAVDVVANVTLVDTVTTNTDMRGTDGANTIAPDNASIALILADTNELQTNQGAWATASGFATPADVSNSQAAIQSDISGLNDISAADVRTELSTELARLDVAISTRSSFNPAVDVVANVTLVDTVTTNTDMRGTDGANTTAPDNASISAILVDTNELQTNQGNWLTATGFATSAQATDILTQATLARKHLTNRDKIDEDNNTLTRYDDDGTTALVVFDLKDADGTASTTSIFEKTPQ